MPILKWARRLVICLVAASIALPIVAAPAFAKTSPTPTSVTITVALELDCSSVPNTPDARKALKDNGLCGFSKKGGGITPYTTVSGTCGTLSLLLFDAGGGWMQWKAEITSSLGPFVFASYGGSWNNWWGGFGPVGRSYGPGLTSDWLDIFGILTAPGYVTGQINWAQDTLWWGGTCRNDAVVGASTNVT
ncbi:MAG: hypothetical protein IVW53_09010 [Chloroflexi bacterium]|nr:hypothetical protein [Chloroflexota bacterium]